MLIGGMADSGRAESGMAESGMAVGRYGGMAVGRLGGWARITYPTPQRYRSCKMLNCNHLPPYRLTA